MTLEQLREQRKDLELLLNKWSGREERGLVVSQIQVFEHLIEAEEKLQRLGKVIDVEAVVRVLKEREQQAEPDLSQKAPEPGEQASREAIAQVFLDEDYPDCDSRDLADVMLKHWDVRWPISRPYARG